MTDETLSVVIPARNAARFLAEAVASVQRQTLSATEIVIVDDASTDNTAQLAESFGGNVRLLRRPSPGGAGPARNTGAAAARGTWLAFLDADDLWLPTKLATQRAWFRTAPATDVVFGHGGNFTVAPDGTRREELPRPAWLPSAALLRREFFLQHARFEEAPSQNEAMRWYLHLQRTGARLGLVPEPVLLRRLHDTNLRKQADGGRAEDLEVLRAWVRERHRQPGA